MIPIKGSITAPQHPFIYQTICWRGVEASQRGLRRSASSSDAKSVADRFCFLHPHWQSHFSRLCGSFSLAVPDIDGGRDGKQTLQPGKQEMCATEVFLGKSSPAHPDRAGGGDP
jgi:hypothetical protein